ncbi:16S rRNA (adenine(1518)-N(6)/adenine(1519)-N(6))-dimethyltransferase RsmA [candidate division KSB1 bacterium]
MSVYWKKKYGQHLLHDRNILRKIVNSLELSKEETVVEIGCGSGALTEFLLKEQVNTIAVEVDDQFFDILEEKFADNNEFNLVRGDILDMKFDEVVPNDKQVTVAGNLPYNITSQILFYLIEYRESISRMVFMMQKEVAERITAKPRTKDRGILSVICQYYFHPKILFPVSKNCFYPVPKVGSAVIRLVVKKELEQEVSGNIKGVVKTCFGKRRKTLRNNLKTSGYDINKIPDAFDLGRRPEELEVGEYAELTKLLFK